MDLYFGNLVHPESIKRVFLGVIMATPTPILVQNRIFFIFFSNFGLNVTYTFNNKKTKSKCLFVNLWPHN